jgi:nucleotidyltransferase substrate binding protein (TIGR01987 family)
MNQNNYIDITYLKKAQAVFEKFRQNLDTDQEKAGAVQSFEFCYELSWKLMKRVLESRGLEVGSPKDSFRKAREEGLIDDPEIWFEFQKKRNLSVHTYNQDSLNLIVESFDLFSLELAKFLIKLTAIL